MRTREDIAHTREQLANAPEVLAHKLGLPAHVKKKVRTVAKLPAAVVLGVLVSLVLRGLLRRNR